MSRRLNELLRDARDTVHWTCSLDTYLQLQAVDQGSFGRCSHEIEVRVTPFGVATSARS